ASIEAGALLASDDDRVIARYRAFGWALGLAFQLNDDLLGIWGAEQATGKPPTDIARRKKTLPVIYAFEHAGPEDRERLAELYGNGGPSGAEVDEGGAILERTGARDYTRGQARRYRDAARRRPGRRAGGRRGRRPHPSAGPAGERRPGRQGPRPVRPYLADHADHRTVRTPTASASSGAGRPDGRRKVSSEVVSVTRGPTRRLRSGSVAGSV